jgi:hypothetical protein
MGRGFSKQSRPLWAVQILSEGWVHGEELRQWHNLDTQIRDEGEKANREGGVLNPTLLSISKKE